MTGKHTKGMTASELLLKAGNGYEGSNGTVMVDLIDLMGLSRNIRHSECFYALAAKIEAELAQARGKALRQGAELWAKANGWPDFRDGEDFGAWLDRCTYKKPVDDHNEPVQFGDEIELHSRSGGMNKGCLQKVYVNKGPVMILSFVGTYAAYECRYDTECDVLKRPATEALGADGKPIVAGETAYDTKTGIEIVVSRIAKDEGDNVIVCASGDICELQFDPRHITHTPPDTQEKIDSDARKSCLEYLGCIGSDCSECPAKIDGELPSDHYGCGNDCSVAMKFDLLRRQRELVRCRDCWNMAVATDGSRYCAHWSRRVPLDGFCHLGERKESE